MRQREPDRTFGQQKKEQPGREEDTLSGVLGEIGNIKGREADLSIKRNETLFKIANDIEDTRNALKEAEAWVDKLKKHLNQLEGVYRSLTKK
jgi:hypothetical protein